MEILRVWGEFGAEKSGWESSRFLYVLTFRIAILGGITGKLGTSLTGRLENLPPRRGGRIGAERTLDVPKCWWFQDSF